MGLTLQYLDQSAKYSANIHVNEYGTCLIFFKVCKLWHTFPFREVIGIPSFGASLTTFGYFIHKFFSEQVNTSIPTQTGNFLFPKNVKVLKSQVPSWNKVMLSGRLKGRYRTKGNFAQNPFRFLLFLFLKNPGFLLTFVKNVVGPLQKTEFCPKVAVVNAFMHSQPWIIYTNCTTATELDANCHQFSYKMLPFAQDKILGTIGH